MFSVPNNSIRYTHIHWINRLSDFDKSRISQRFTNFPTKIQFDSSVGQQTKNIVCLCDTERPNGLNVTQPDQTEKKVTSSAGSLYFLRSNYIRCLVLNVTFSGTPRVLCQFPYKINFHSNLVSHICCVYVCVSVSFVLHFGFFFLVENRSKFISRFFFKSRFVSSVCVSFDSLFCVKIASSKI